MRRYFLLAICFFCSFYSNGQTWDYILLTNSYHEEVMYPFHYKFRLTNENDTSRIIKSNFTKSNNSSIKINLVNNKNEPILFTRVRLTRPGFHNFEYPKSDLTGEYIFDNLEIMDTNFSNTFYEISITDLIYKPFKEKIHLTVNKNIHYVIYLARKPSIRINVLKSKKKLQPSKINRIIYKRFNKHKGPSYFLDKIFARFKSYQFFIEI